MKTVKIIENFKYSAPFNLTTSGNIPDKIIKMVKQREIYRRAWKIDNLDYDQETNKLVINYNEKI